MSPPPATPLSRRSGPTTFPWADRRVGFVVATALAAAIVLVFSGCSTQAVHPKVDLPAQYAASSALQMEPEAAWWESFHDPVLTDLIARAARENRDVKVAAERLSAARAGETVSR